MYIVYMHICPNNKKYIGITSQKPEKRWGNGKNYIGNSRVLVNNTFLIVAPSI